MTKNRHIVALALLFSITLNFPFIAEYLRYGSHSILSFNDIDEPNYLRLPFAVVNGLGPESFYAEHRTQKAFSEISSGHPNRFVDYIIGLALQPFNISPIELGLGLDLVCAFLGFALGFKILRRLCSSSLIAAAGTVVMLAFPWVFWPGELLTYDWGAGSHFASSQPSALSVHFYPRIPIFRGIYTQLGVLLFLGVVLLGLNVASERERSLLKLLGLGVLAGCSLYIYFYCWIACCVLVPVLIAAFSNQDKGAEFSKRWRKIIGDTGLFALGAILSCLPALLSILNRASAAPMNLGEIGNYWFLPLEYGLLVIALVSFLLVKQLKSPEKSVLVILLAIPLIDIAFSNLQPLFKVWLEPHHLGKYFLWPLFSGLLSVVLLEALHRRRLRLVPKAAALAPLIFGVLVVAYYEKNLEGEIPLRKSFAELIQHLETTLPSAAVIATYPFLADSDTETLPRLTNTPNILSALSGRPIFLQYTNSWLSGIADDELLEREELTSLFYRGRFDLMIPCPPPQPALPGDLFSFTTSLRYFGRRALCEKWTARSKADVCSIRQRYRADYLLGDSAEISAALIKLGRPLAWQSSDGSLSVFHAEIKDCLEKAQT